MRVFLDTNIIIDFCAERKDFFKAAALIFTLGKRGKIELVASCISFVNAFYILRKYYPKSILFEKLKAIAHSCRISKTDEEVLHRCFDEEYPDFEDAMQYFSATTDNVDVIVTRNKKHFVMSGANRLMAPEEFLDAFFAGKG